MLDIESFVVLFMNSFIEAKMLGKLLLCAYKSSKEQIVTILLRNNSVNFHPIFKIFFLLKACENHHLFKPEGRAKKGP